MKNAASKILTVILLSACGRYLPPIPPEDTAPAAVENLTVSKAEAGILLQWEAPSHDRRGKKLTQIDRYDVYRVALEDVQISNRASEALPFVRIASIQDPHLEKLKALQDQAEIKGQITRKVQLPAQDTQFQFLDTSAKVNQAYVYKVTPINQGDEKGGVKKLVRARMKDDGEIETFDIENRLEDKAS